MQIDLLSDLAVRFVMELADSDRLKEQQEAQERRKDRAGALLQASAIPTLSDLELRELFFDSNAFGFWRNKDAEFERRERKVGLDGLRSTLQFLIERAVDGL